MDNEQEKQKQISDNRDVVVKENGKYKKINEQMLEEVLTRKKTADEDDLIKENIISWTHHPI